MTNSQGTRSMIATNRLHRPFDNNRVAFIPLRPDGNLPRVDEIARHLSKQFQFPLEADDFESFEERLDNKVPYELVLNLTGRLDGPIRVYFYGKASGSKTPGLQEYIDLAVTGVKQHGLLNCTQHRIDRAMYLAFGIEFGTRYESPQAAHYQLHYLRCAKTSSKIGKDMMPTDVWSVNILIRNIHSGAIEHQTYDLDLPIDWK